MTQHIQLRLGDRLGFADEKRTYTVRAVSVDGRWAICTKPFNAMHTVLYTVIDFAAGVRGPDNCHGLGYETDEQCAEALDRFEEGTARHSGRNKPIPVRITRWIAAPAPAKADAGAGS